MLATPPPNMSLVGWRDPYIFETKSKDNEHEWGMLLGSGIKGKGGAVLIYRSASLRSGKSQDQLLKPVIPSHTGQQVNAKSIMGVVSAAPAEVFCGMITAVSRPMLLCRLAIRRHALRGFHLGHRGHVGVSAAHRAELCA